MEVKSSKLSTILADGLDILNQQTLMNGDYNKIVKKAPHRFLDNMDLGYIPKYTKTSQLDSQTIRYNGTDETQDFKYPNISLEIPPPIEYTNFNFAIDKHIKRKPIDISGQIIPNDELRVFNNKGGTKFPSVKYVVNTSKKDIPKENRSKYVINSSYRNVNLQKRNDLVDVNTGFNIPRQNVLLNRQNLLTIGA